MEVRVRDIRAVCSCGCSDFLPKGEAPFKTGDVFVCGSCEKAWTYGTLLEQIGEEAMQRSSRALKSLQKSRKKKLTT